MRLLYVTSSMPHGAGEGFLFPEVAELVARGVELKIVPMYPRGRVMHAVGARIADLTVAEGILSAAVVLSSLKVIRKWPIRVLRAFALILTAKPKLLLKNLAVFPKGLWLAWLSREWGANHIHAHWASTSSTMAMVASEISRVPWSLTAHRWDILEGNLLARKARHAKFFRCVSQKSLEAALARGVPAEKAFVLHLGVELPRMVPFYNRSELVLLCPAALIPRKGHVHILKAMQQLPEQVHLWLAGDGVLRQDLERMACDLGLGARVKFLGFLPREELLEIYKSGRVDVVVLATEGSESELGEGIPFSLIEAMSFGYPVIATNTGGVSELLGGGAGILVPAGSPELLASAVLMLLKNPEQRRELGQQARRRISEEFSVASVVPRLLALIEECGG